MHHVKLDLGISPAKEHIITSIKYQGLNQMRREFIQRLTSSTIKYVISKVKYQRERKQLLDDGFDEPDINAEIFHLATGYFRKSDIKGQFSELLLFNLLQYHFEAIPVVRKMMITTNTGLERNGSDAIHLGLSENGEYCVYLGEAKTYTSGFTKAFGEAIKSIIKSYNEHRNELQLLSYAEFLESEVRDLMREYLNGTIDLPVKLVIIISYCTGKTLDLESKEAYIKHYIEHAINECRKITDTHFRDEEKNKINPGLLHEIHYILFPINELEEILKDFQLQLGLK